MHRIPARQSIAMNSQPSSSPTGHRQSAQVDDEPNKMHNRLTI